MNHLPYKAYDLVILITHLSYNKFHSDRSRYKALSNCFFFFFFFFFFFGIHYRAPRGVMPHVALLDKIYMLFCVCMYEGPNNLAFNPNEK